MHRVDDQLVLADEFIQVEAKRDEVSCQFLGLFLERHKDAGLTELRGSADQKFHDEQGFANAGAAALKIAVWRAPMTSYQGKRNLFVKRYRRCPTGTR